MQLLMTKWRVTTGRVGIFCFLLSTFCFEIGLASAAEKRPSPPMGWNSYTGYSIAVTEEELLKNIDFLNEKLLKYGYDTVTVDNGWFLSGEGEGITIALDAFGRPDAHPHFFPHGLKYTVDYAHKKGVKFGIWLLRGINRRAVEENLPVEGTNYRMQDIVNRKSACPWAVAPWWNYGVDMAKPGAQEYYNGLVRKYSDLGVDFIKFDDIVPNPVEVEAVAKAIKRCGRPVVLSLSPGDEIKVDHSEAYRKANMVRITSDIWDDRHSLSTTFQRWEAMQTYTGPEVGSFLDMDMICFGRLYRGKEDGSWECKFTPDQKRTFMVQRALAASPLMLGGVLYRMDDFSMSLFTNADILWCDQNGVIGRLAHREGKLDVWKTPERGAENSGWIGVFNRDGGKKASVELSDGQLGLSAGRPYQLKNLWSGEVLPAGEKRAFEIPTDGVVFLSYRSSGSMVASHVDWAEFLKRHDLVWAKLPDRFDHGAFAGNGMLGTTIYQENGATVRFAMGRSDITEHRRDNGRIVIGGLQLKTSGKIVGGGLRTDLWNAEVRGTVTTEAGAITFRAFVHAKEPVIVVDFSATGNESPAWHWDAAPAVGFQDFKDSPSPKCDFGKAGEVEYCEQRRAAGGSYSAAWKIEAARVLFALADTFPGEASKQESIETVQRVSKLRSAELVEAHRAWWHSYYPESFVSVPDAQIEGFYWIQIYKLGSAMRPDGMVLDLQGPWNRRTGWPRIWWNLNIQIAYSPVFAANRLELGESFTRFIDAKRDNFVRNAKDLYKIEDGATVPHTTDNEGLRGNGDRAPDFYINPGDFTWALWLYWLQYRYSMDESLVSDQRAHAFYPMLKGSVNVYRSILKKGQDGKLHLPKLLSPEYDHDEDNNYNLSLLRWACTTLLDLDARFKLHDPQSAEWEQILRDLVPYPTDENGFRIGKNVTFGRSHRHWSHMLMVWPLHQLSLEQPESRVVVEKTLRHWLTVDHASEIYGWSSAAASCLYSCLGDGENALTTLRAHHNNKRFVMANTQYYEGDPVIECSLFAATSLQHMLIQSWGGTIRVFPAMPVEWKDGVFHDLRTEGAFLVSAERRNGKTRWARVKSLAGEPCRIKPGLEGGARAVIDGKDASMKALGDGVYELALAKGAEALLYAGDPPPRPTVEPVAAATEDWNSWGIKVRKRVPALSSGKPAKASSVWSAEYDAAKALDDDDSTRWGAAPNSRSGWLEVDLEQDTLIGRVVIMELGFHRTEEFAVEYKAGETWRELVHGTTIAGEKALGFAPVRARCVRLNIIKANEVPTIEEFRILKPQTQP